MTTSRQDEADRQAAAKRESDLKAQAEHAERQKVEAQERAANAEKAAKERAEREQAQRQAQEKADAEKREANKRHAAKINNAAKDAFVKGGLSVEHAQLAVELIAKRLIPSVTITY